MDHRQLQQRAIEILGQFVETLATEMGLSAEEAASFRRTYLEIMALPQTTD
jgi:hypothetical protein